MRKMIFLVMVQVLFFQLLFAGGVKKSPEANTENGFTFDEWFKASSLRIDYMLCGNSSEEKVFFRAMKEEPYYGGPRKNLTLLGNTGTYRYCLYDSAGKVMLFAKGFCSLFQEWKGTPEAMNIQRAFPMAAVMPFPRKTMRFVIEKRSFETGKFEPLYSMMVKPGDYSIGRAAIRKIKTDTIRYSGEPSNKVDVAFLAEGYTADEMGKFIADARSFCEYFLKTPPYDGLGDRFNFYAVMSPSEESGVTIPGSGIYVNTSAGSSFYTFDMDRYLTSFNTESIYDIAANVSCDAIFILINSKRYGGGGFYNHYCEGTADNVYSRLVALHEFGHSFAGLADEYYNSEITYSGFYNLKTEPWEPNITTNVDFASKWKSMVADSIPIPTPSDKKYKAVTGLFEGGGYLAKGIFRPQMDCRMKSNEAQGFCPVCSDAIVKMVKYYCGE